MYNNKQKIILMLQGREKATEIYYYYILLTECHTRFRCALSQPLFLHTSQQYIIPIAYLLYLLFPFAV